MSREVALANLTFLLAFIVLFIGDKYTSLTLISSTIIIVFLFVIAFRTKKSPLPPVAIGIICAAGLMFIVLSGVVIAFVIENSSEFINQNLPEDFMETLLFFLGLLVAFNIGVLANEHSETPRAKAQTEANAVLACARIYYAANAYLTGVIAPNQMIYDAKIAYGEFLAQEIYHRKSLPAQQVKKINKMIHKYVEDVLVDPTKAETKFNDTIGEIEKICRKFYILGSGRFRYTEEVQRIANSLF